MILADFAIGYFIPDLFGWLFLVVVIALETLLLKKLLNKSDSTFTSLLSLVVLANLITTFAGYGVGELLTLDETKLGHLINIVPISRYRGEYFYGMAIIVYVASFLCTMVFETLVFFLGLKNHQLGFKKTLRTSLILNLASYGLGIVIIALYALKLRM